jgi:hypothetical protein
MQELIMDKDRKDVKGWTIPKDTRIFILDELLNPMSKKKELIVAIDNGTGIKKLYPKTLIEDWR